MLERIEILLQAIWAWAALNYEMLVLVTTQRYKPLWFLWLFCYSAILKLRNIMQSVDAVGESEVQEAEGDVVNEQNGPVEGREASEKEEEAMDVWFEDSETACEVDFFALVCRWYGLTWNHELSSWCYFLDIFTGLLKIASKC